MNEYLLDKNVDVFPQTKVKKKNSNGIDITLK